MEKWVSCHSGWGKNLEHGTAPVLPPPRKRCFLNADYETQRDKNEASHPFHEGDPEFETLGAKVRWLSNEEPGYICVECVRWLCRGKGECKNELGIM